MIQSNHTHHKWSCCYHWQIFWQDHPENDEIWYSIRNMMIISVNRVSKKKQYIEIIYQETDISIIKLSGLFSCFHHSLLISSTTYDLRWCLIRQTKIVKDAKLNHLSSLFIHWYTLDSNKFINVVSCHYIIWIGSSWNKSRMSVQYNSWNVR